jgi:hypothetical protein
LNHVDAKGINSLATLVSENGRSFIRRYLLDFGSALGSAAVGPREGWEGFEPLVERPTDIAKRAMTFGFLIPKWRTMAWYEAPSIGRIPVSHDSWDPQAWAPHILSGAFRHMRLDDAFWAAEKLTFITDDMIDAAIAEGEFDDPDAERALARMIRERRDRILQTYLPALNPVTQLTLGADGLRFDNLAVTSGVAAPPERYHAAWFAFDNATGDTSPLGETAAPTSPLPLPEPLSRTGFIKVEIDARGGPAAWANPVTAHFRRRGSEWQLVGFVRMP